VLEQLAILQQAYSGEAADKEHTYSEISYLIEWRLPA
jgi:hypothetical protein